MKNIVDRLTESEIDWSKLSSINKRTAQGLRDAEMRELSPEDVVRVNDLIAQMDLLSMELYDKLEVARNLGRGFVQDPR